MKDFFDNIFLYIIFFLFTVLIFYQIALVIVLPFKTNIFILGLTLTLLCAIIIYIIRFD